MLELFDGVAPAYTIIEELLEAIDSCRSTAADRLKAVSRIEEEFGKIVLASDDEPTSSTRAAKKAWWDAQKRPRSCVALSLISLIHRLHQQCLLVSSGKGIDESELISSQLITCFTILQGLCLKDFESQRMCGRKSTLELIIDLIGADYWNSWILPSNAPAHAIDLLICITISSSSASKLIESLQGEEVVRTLMEKQTFGKDGETTKTTTSGMGRRAVTLDDVQGNPLAIKCAEFLLFFEYGSEEFKAEGEMRGGGEGGDASGLSSDTFRTAISRFYPRRSRPEVDNKQDRIERHDRCRSSSPVKGRSRRGEERMKAIRSRPLQSSTTSLQQQLVDSPIVRTPLQGSPTKSAPVSRESRRLFKTSLTPVATKSNTATKTTTNSPRKQQQRQFQLRRGRSRERSPFGSSINNSQAEDSPNTSTTFLLSSTTSSSPLKAIMGPSPAVQRAQARSTSPAKKRLQ